MPQENHADANHNEKPYENKKPPKAGLWAIGVGGVVAAVVIVGVGFLYIKEAERVAFITVNLLSLSVLIAITVQAYIYRKQWEAMRDTLEETRRIAGENERAAKAMEQAIDETKTSREIENRAFVAVKSIIMDWTLLEARRKGKFTVRLKFENAGKTPARNVRVNCQTDLFVIIPHSIQPTALAAILSDTKSYSVMISGHDYTAVVEFDWPHEVVMTESELQNVYESGTHKTFMYGNILYDDVFNKPRITTFCGFIPSLRNTYFEICHTPDHNTIK